MLRILSCETGSAISPRVSLLILHSRFSRRRSFIPSTAIESVLSLSGRADHGVHCRESVGTGPVVLKVVPVTSSVVLGIMYQFLCASLLPHPTVVYVYSSRLVADIYDTTIKCYCVCVCFLPIHSGHQVRWTYQPGSHRRKVTQDF